MKLSYYGEKLLGTTVSTQVKDDLSKFITLVNELRSTASKHTHYDRLDEWSEIVYEKVHQLLDKYGFINGDVEANNANAEVTFWWNIYGLIGNITYSPNLKTNTANHHSSAWERNEALYIELKEIYNKAN